MHRLACKTLDRAFTYYQRGLTKRFSCNYSSYDFSNTNMSYCRGSNEIKLIDVPIGEKLEEMSKKHPYVDSLISAHQKVKLSYAELNNQVDVVSKSLIALDLPYGARIGIYAPNSEEWLLIQLSCARVGYVLVNINPAYQVNDLKYVLKKVQINCLFMPRCLKSSNYLDIINEIAVDLKENHQNPLDLKLKELPDMKSIVLIEDMACGQILDINKHVINETDPQFFSKVCMENKMIYWKDFYYQTFKSKYSSNEIELEYLKRKSSVNVHDPVNIQFTSGTTGLPKGAVLSHYNIINNGYLVGRRLNYTTSDKALIQVPLYHCFGTVLGNLACITNGATIIYPNGIFDANKSLEVIEQEKPTSLYGVPTMFLEILNKQEKLKKDVMSLRKGIMAGSICPKYLMERCIKELGITELTICYGMTELSPVTHQTSPYDNFDKKTTTVGTLLPHTITKIVNDCGEVLPRNHIGEVCSISYGLMKGYYGDEQATKQVIDSEGFMKTGDLGFVDDDGYLHIEGRSKDVIIRGGENISPKELEDFLGTHPKIDNVQVLAVKDEKFGDEICAWIIPKEQFKENLSKVEIIKFCKSQIAHYKIPRYIRFVNSFPMTVTGKPQKFKMREITNKIINDKSEEL